MRAIVFATSRAEAARAARTTRALAAAGVADVVDAARDANEALAARLVESAGGAWLVRAGSWPVGAPREPAASATGRPLVAIGRDDGPEWDEAVARTGGDFGREAPRLGSAYLDREALRIVARKLARGARTDDALRAATSTGDLRVVRFPALDVHGGAALRVVEVTTSFQQGGAERIVIDLVRALRARGAAVLPVALGRPTRRAYDAPQGTLDLSELRSDRAERARALVDATRAFGADVLHAHLLDARDLAALAPAGVPVVVTVHNARFGWPDGLGRIRGDEAALLVACARAVEADLREATLPVPARTVWNGIDVLRHSPAGDRARRDERARLGIGEQDLVLLSIANPRPQKRLHLLPAIAHEARRATGRDVHVIVAGASSPAGRPAEEELRSEIARRGMDRFAHLVGSVDDTGALCAAADVLVAPSAWEGLSLAQLEALAAGLPVVTTEVGGAPEISATGALHLVAPDAPAEAYGHAIARAAEGGRCGALPASFTTARMAERYDALLERAARATRARRRGVLVVTNNFSTGGAQSSTRRLLVGLRARGVDARAAVLEEREDHPTPGLAALRAAGVPVLVAPAAGEHDPEVTARAVIELLDEAPPAAVLFVNAIFEHKLLVADAAWDVPVFDASPGEMFFASMDRWFARPRPGLPYTSPRDYGARLAGVVVKYHGEAARAAEALGAPVHVVPNGVPLRGRPARRDAGDGRRPIVVGTAARIAPQKMLDQLVDALRHAHARLPTYVVRVAGGMERGCEDHAPELRARAEGLPFEWLGERQDVGAFLDGLDVFAMISEPAGCPNASLEAMAAGLPIAATNHGGAAEQIEDGVTGRLVPRGDARALGDAIVELARDPALRATMGDAGRARAEQMFGVERMLDDYARVLGL
jgi:glycosyltransferase involved in cell wall biosynthesis